jgi:hypothetical protein
VQYDVDRAKMAQPLGAIDTVVPQARINRDEFLSAYEQS